MNVNSMIYCMIAFAAVISILYVIFTDGVHADPVGDWVLEVGLKDKYDTITVVFRERYSTSDIAEKASKKMSHRLHSYLMRRYSHIEGTAVFGNVTDPLGGSDQVIVSNTYNANQRRMEYLIPVNRFKLK